MSMLLGLSGGLYKDLGFPNPLARPKAEKQSAMADAIDLPNDIDRLKELVLTRRAELAVAKGGMLARSLDVEKMGPSQNQK
jgi:hypothetical protein